MHMRKRSDVEKVGHLQAGTQEQEKVRGPPMFSLGDPQCSDCNNPSFVHLNERTKKGKVKALKSPFPAI